MNGNLSLSIKHEKRKKKREKVKIYVKTKYLSHKVELSSTKIVGSIIRQY